MKKLNYQTIKGRCFKALIVLLLAPLSSWAQNLTVGGVEVTSGEYLVSDNIEGLVSFDAETNTLTLEDATITGGYMTNGCITSGLSHLTIYLIGENKICSTDSSTAIRSTANEATLTIVKGADNCKLVFDAALRCIRDFKTVSIDGLSWNGAYTYEYENAEWQPGYRLMGADGYEATISYDTGVRPTLGDPVPTMSTYSGQSNETRLFLQNDFDLPMYYSIDYVSNDLQDVSATQYTEAPELLGPCTVTAYVKKSNGVNGTSVVGKYFGFVSSSPYGLPSRSSASLSEGWWRWRESNPRPKQLQSNFYARSVPLISEEVCRRTGLSPSTRSVVRGRDARAERFRPSPAELCRGGLAGVCRATSGP